MQDHVTSFSVDFWQKGCSCLVPTFSTPFIQRRYSIKATITFRNTTNHDFHLEIPVQVCTGADWEAVTPAYTEGMDSNFSSGIVCAVNVHRGRVSNEHNRPKKNCQNGDQRRTSYRTICLVRVGTLYEHTM